jgi:O-antigen/teichoic acid export membrane protein
MVRLPTSEDPFTRRKTAADATSARGSIAPPAQPSNSSAVEVGRRAVTNTLLRSGGELIGRLASLLLFAVTARIVGESGLGAFVFAVAYLGFVMVVVDLGCDRLLLLAIARDRTAGDRLFFNMLWLKLALAVPLIGASLALLPLLGYSHTFQATTWALAPGVFSDSVARMQLAVFLGHERSGPPSLADMIQRVLSAAFGIAALEAGWGVVAVAAGYSIGSTIGVVIGFVLLARTIGLPEHKLTPRRWRSLALQSIPFASQDAFSVLLSRMDTLILSLLAAEAIVGSYGAAYRLFESTFLITYALVGAFSAMYAYLGHDTHPTVGFMFQRSIKFALVLLVPIAVFMAALADPICRDIYGAGFASSATPLRILAPATVLLGVVSLATSLLLSREPARRMVPVTAAIVVFNLVLNVVLIPPYGDSGAAIAMLASEVVFAVWVMSRAARVVGGIDWLATLAGPLAGGAVMAVAAVLLLTVNLPLAIAGGVLGYLLGLVIVERAISPDDLRLMADMVRRRLPGEDLLAAERKPEWRIVDEWLPEGTEPTGRPGADVL